MSAENKVKEFVQRLIVEGDAVIASKWQPNGNYLLGPPTYVDIELFQQWRSRCRLLVSMLGTLADPWKPILASEAANKMQSAKSTQGALKGVRQSLEEGLLIPFEDLVLAEAFSDLSEQAEYLFSQGYFLASGVITRAILEERLRRLCVNHDCTPDRERPTLGDLNTALYKKTVYDKITFKHVDALGAVGNHAAHNDPDLNKEDVRRMIDGVQAFLLRFST